MLFSELWLHEKLLQALDEKGYETPTEIQEKAIQAFSTGKHIVWQSQTWSGKTAAFVLPVLNAINPRLRAPQVLILAPTRELAAQIRDEVFELSKHMYVRSVSVFGGTSKRKQIEILERGPQIIVGTPGRVADLIDMRKIKLQDIDYFILDEVDRMLDMWFIDTIRQIRQRLDTVKQVMTFSATIPDELQGIIGEYIGTEDEYVSIKVSQKIMVDTVNHMFMEVNDFRKYEILKSLLEVNPDMKTVVFAETKRKVDDLARMLKKDWFRADSLHGDMDQRDRFHTLKWIKSDHTRILVATDVAARWLNMKSVWLVLNFEVPTDSESYIHRVGRTARAGKEGTAIMLVDPSEYKYLHAIERRNKLTIQRVAEDGQEVERTDNKRRRWRWTQSRSRRYQRGGWHSSWRRGNYRGKQRGQSRWWRTTSRWQSRWSRR